MHTQTKGAQTCYHKADKAFKQSFFNLFHSVFIYIHSERTQNHPRPPKQFVDTLNVLQFIFILSSRIVRPCASTNNGAGTSRFLSFPSYDRGHYSYTQYRDKGVKLNIGNTYTRTIIHAHIHARESFKSFIDIIAQSFAQRLLLESFSLFCTLCTLCIIAQSFKSFT